MGFPIVLYEGELAEMSGLALESTLARRFGPSEVLSWSNGGAYLAAAGDTDITPSAGTQLRLLWVSLQPRSDNTEPNLVSIGFPDLEPIYTAEVIGHWQAVDAPAVDTPLRITLANSQPVAVTVHYLEVTP